VNTSTILELWLFSGVAPLVVAIGMRARPHDSLLLLRRPELGVPAMVTMFVLQPAFVLLVVWALDLQVGVGATLLAFSVAPVLPPWGKKGYAPGAATDYVIGLEVLSAVVSIFVVPVWIWIVQGVFGVHTARDPWSVELILLATIGLPLALGMGITRWKPASAERRAFLVDRVGGIILLSGMVALIGLRLRVIFDVIGGGTVVVILLVIAFGLLLGHLMGGPDLRRRGALASGNVSRHPAVALLLATSALPDHRPAALGTVIIYLLANMLVPIPYERWLKKTVAAGNPQGAA
jgi:BASS family bile acid:Na+ symporter